jgi:serine/threonine-protein kinase
VLDGLDYAHHLTDEDGRPLAVVHRDVSPQNVMLSFDGDVKVIDFGLAASTIKVERTETNVVMGKVAYMPPEQVRGERADASADVFAVAVVAYELLVGRRYYEGVEQYALSGVVANGDHVPPGMATLDPALRAIIERALVADRGRRTRAAAALAEDLRAFAASKGWRGDAAGVRRRRCFRAAQG